MTDKDALRQEDATRSDDAVGVEETPEAAVQQDRQDASADAEAAATVEAILFASDNPLSPAKVSDIGQLDGVRGVRKAIVTLNERYRQAGCSFRIVQIAGGFQMQTLPEYNDVVSRLFSSRRESRLSQAALETLAVVAYRQPVLRANVEAVRGVACGEVLRGLMDKGLVRIAGRAEEIGRPMLYGTTRHFLEVFGLSDLKELPNVEQLRMPLPAAEKPPDEDQNASDSTENATDRPENDGDSTENATDRPENDGDGHTDDALQSGDSPRSAENRIHSPQEQAEEPQPEND